ncbi:MAG TPA: hypothetical protein VMZ03_04045 [Chitinophagaceae bacterium]|nr:hypothetical protein [Chitinophagaceae bacterium]
MKYNLIAAAVNVSRAYEVAKIGNLKVKLIACSNPELIITERDLELLNNFYGFEPVDDPDIFMEVFISHDDLVSTINPSNRFETIDQVNARIAAADFMQIKVDRKLNSICRTLLKTAVQKLQFGLNDVLKIMDITEAIAMLSHSTEIFPEHIAEAIHYRSIKL